MVLKGIGFLVYNGFWGDLVYRGMPSIRGGDDACFFEFGVLFWPNCFT